MLHPEQKAAPLPWWYDKNYPISRQWEGTAANTHVATTSWAASHQISQIDCSLIVWTEGALLRVLMKGVLPDDICINNSILAVDSPPKLIVLLHEKSTGSIPPFGISMPSLKVLLKHILLQHIGMDYPLNRTTQHQDEALSLLIVALYPLSHIFVVISPHPFFLLCVMCL